MVKRASETDQRQSHVYLTQAGLQTIKAIEKSIRKTEKGYVERARQEGSKSLLKMLGRMEGNWLLRGAARVADEPETEPQEDDEAE
ncbi:MarR family transcriptional regulator [Brucella melitensis]